MKNQLRANLEFGAQLVIAIGIIVVAGLLVKQHFFPASTGFAKATQVSAGEKLNVPNVDWQQNRKSLVFFLQKGCRYCDASASFYRQLIADADNKGVQSLAILPNSIEDARQYLQSLQLPVKNVQTGSLASYKIHGTPTVLFVDGNGIVKRVWYGAMLGPEEEAEMRNGLWKLFEGPH